MDILQLGKDIISLAEKVAPLVGLDDELALGKGAIEAVINLASNTKDALHENDQAKLEVILDDLIARTKAHAAKTKAALQG